MDNKALFKISYGLYALITRYQGKDNACIVNTVNQVTSTPNRISVTVNKQNYTRSLILKTGQFNISTLSTDTTFDLIKKFGFQSGRSTDKFSEVDFTKRSENSLLYLTKYANAYMSATVVDEIDLGTHTMFIAELTDAEILSDTDSLTYDYYQKNVKESPKKLASSEGSVWRCTICSYEYVESKGDPQNGIAPGTKFEDLPDDWVCPICKHPKSDFEKVS